MKSPAELKTVLRKQWENALRRESRLLLIPGSWPITLSIGRPSARKMSNDLDTVKQHVDAWRKVSIGDVKWQPVQYRATQEPVEIPVQWCLQKPSDWIAACSDHTIKREFDAMCELVASTDSRFHPFWIRRRAAWRDKPLEEVVLAGKLAIRLEPNIANGKPLRTLSLEGIDTKFFERHSRLLTQLLDVRYDGEVSRMGLEVFLGALQDGDHWLLVIDLDGGLLPFRRQRVPASEIGSTKLPCDRLIVVENESCQHLLPRVPGCIAILGSGFDLQWMQGEWLDNIAIAYWGDIDTWGLQFLAQARRHRPKLVALLMNDQIYSSHHQSAVPEPVVASTEIPAELLTFEKHLYARLLSETRGRLEQEYLDSGLVADTISGLVNAR